MPTTSPRALMEASTVCVAPAGTNSWYLKDCPWAAPPMPITNEAQAAHRHSFPCIENFKLAPEKECMKR